MIKSPALFLGDSRYDHQAATQAGLEFVFISEWSEVKDWKGWCEREAISTVAQLADFACTEDGIDPHKPLSGE